TQLPATKENPPGVPAINTSKTKGTAHVAPCRVRMAQSVQATGRLETMVRSLLLCLFVGLAASPLAAQEYPTRTITFICPFPAGGGSDVFARMLAQELQDKLKQTVIVENRVGAGTVIAAQAVARSAPDGYTLFLAPVTTLD